MLVSTAARQKVSLSNTDKILFPGDGITKGDLIDYYDAIAETMLPHIRGRPVTMHRFPEGLNGEDFYQQNAPGYFPDWITRVTVPKEGGTVTHVVCDDAGTLVYLANQGCVTPHTWLSRHDKPDRPDRMIFDLDPSGEGFDPVRRGALALRDLLDEAGLQACVMTTGSRGLHVMVPLDGSVDFEAVRTWARRVADELARRNPEELTTEQRKVKRRGRVFVDTLRNSYAQTAVPPYAVRAKPGAPVATPLEWNEVARRSLHPRTYTIRNIFRRLGQKRDPWVDMDRRAATLPESPAEM